MAGIVSTSCCSRISPTSTDLERAGCEMGDPSTCGGMASGRADSRSRRSSTPPPLTTMDRRRRRRPSSTSPWSTTGRARTLFAGRRRCPTSRSSVTGARGRGRDRGGDPRRSVRARLAPSAGGYRAELEHADRCTPYVDRRSPRWSVPLSWTATSAWRCWKGVAPVRSPRSRRRARSPRSPAMRRSALLRGRPRWRLDRGAPSVSSMRTSSAECRATLRCGVLDALRRSPPPDGDGCRPLEFTPRRRSRSWASSAPAGPGSARTPRPAARRRTRGRGPAG